MSENAKRALAIYQGEIGRSDGHGEWLRIDQDRINLFADATLDHQFIHVDPDKAARLSPYQTTIAHGFLTLSLLPHLTSSIPVRDPSVFEGMVMGINYGVDRARFPAPVPVGARLRAERTLRQAELKGGNTIQLTQRITIEVDGGKKPACVADFVMRMVYG